VADRWQTGGRQVVDMWQTGDRQVADRWQTGGGQVADRWQTGKILLIFYSYFIHILFIFFRDKILIKYTY
jgi:hypothetical protein